MSERIETIKKIISTVRPSALKRSNPELVDEIIQLTSFLPEGSPIKRRMWHVSNSYMYIPVCSNCNEEQIYFRLRTCSYIDCCRSCHKKREQINRESANLSKYGTTSTLRTPNAIRLSKETIQQKYGVDNVSQSAEIRRKIINTNIQRHGTDNPSKSEEIKKRKAATCLKNIGVDNPLKDESIRDRIRSTNLRKYGTEIPVHSGEIRAKIINTNMLKYGGPNPSCSPEVRRKAEATMLEKYGNHSFMQSRLPGSSLDILKSPEVLRELNSTMPASEIAQRLGVAQSTVLNYIHSHGLTPTLFGTSQAEREIRELFASYDCSFNVRDIINGELDVYVPALKLAIEYNGLYWHSEANGRGKWYHRNKYEECLKKGIRLISILESEWIDTKELVISKLKRIANISDDVRIFARKCTVAKLSAKNKSEFLNANHIQGDGTSSINYALQYNGETVACMAVMKDDNAYLINRYATSCIVVGGFTKLLAALEREYNRPKIYTFADLRWSRGELYLNSGFIQSKEIPPDYYWVKGGKAWHKFNWRHSTGLKTLPGYSRDKSESAIMREHGFSKLWDCGKLQFIKNGK